MISVTPDGALAKTLELARSKASRPCRNVSHHSRDTCHSVGTVLREDEMRSPLDAC